MVRLRIHAAVGVLAMLLSTQASAQRVTQSAFGARRSDTTYVAAARLQKDEHWRSNSAKGGAAMGFVAGGLGFYLFSGVGANVCAKQCNTISGGERALITVAGAGVGALVGWFVGTMADRVF